MIAVLGSELDAAARGLVEAWSAEDAVLISARDLCTCGWKFHATCADGGTFVAGGVRRQVAHLRGAIVRRPAVAAEELPWIADDDRHYVAAEINAFLVAWLSALRCPVLNRPTATALCGPAWSQTAWHLEAARAGVKWSSGGDFAALDEMVYCAGLCHGATRPARKRAAARLSAMSGAQLLGVRFSGDAVAAVTLQPALTDPGARDIVLAHFRATVQ